MSARRLDEKKVEVQDLPPIGRKERNTSFTRGHSIERGGRSGRLPVVVLETWPCWVIDSDGEVACRHRQLCPHTYGNCGYFSLGEEEANNSSGLFPSHPYRGGCITRRAS